MLYFCANSERLDDFLQFVRQERAHAGTRRAEHGRSERGRRAAFIEHGDERFADSKIGQQLLGFVECCLGIILRDQLDRFAILRGEGAQGVLHFHPELPENVVRDIGRQLRAEENADAFGADEFDDAFRFRRGATFSASSKIRCASSMKENELWFLQVADFRQRGVELGQHLEHERGEKFRTILHIREAQNRDRAEAVDHPQQIRPSQTKARRKIPPRPVVRVRSVCAG